MCNEALIPQGSGKSRLGIELEIPAGSTEVDCAQEVVNQLPQNLAW